MTAFNITKEKSRLKSGSKETLVIATHGFIKKVDKVPAKEIDRAIRLRDKYFKNKEKK